MLSHDSRPATPRLAQLPPSCRKHVKLVFHYAKPNDAAPLAAAHEKNSKTTKQRRVCKANFYGEELPLLQNAKEEVLRLSK
jgi:hypothetical protein